MRPTPAAIATPVLVAPAAGTAAAGVACIARFYAAHPTGRIITELVTRAREVVVFRAAVYRGADDTQPAATGWAAAGWGLGPPFERAEEVAVARALANLGFANGPEARRRARADAAHGVGPLPAEVPNDDSVRADDVAPAAARPLDAAGMDAAGMDAAGVAGDDTLRPPRAAGGDALSGRAVLAADLTLLVARAARYGLRPRRAARWRVRLASGVDAPEVLRTAEQRLRAWVERRRAEPYAGAV